MRAQARAQLTQHVYTFGIVRLPSLALAVSKAAALAAGLAALAGAALAGLALGHGSRWRSFSPALAGCLGAGLPGLASWLPFLGPSRPILAAFSLPSVHCAAGGAKGVKIGVSWPRLAGLASHTADTWRLPLPRLPWRYKDSASGFLGGSLPGLPCGPGSLPFLAFVLPLMKGGGLAGWLACGLVKKLGLL